MTAAPGTSVANLGGPVDIRHPGADALAAAADLAGRNHSRTAQIRASFMLRPTPEKASPLGRMLRGGRGGQVRLKLYLSLMWLAAAPPHDAAYPSRAWATLLGLKDPAGLGARRVNDALKWLEENKFLTIEQRPGLPNRVTLLMEDGSGQPYSVPGEHMKRLSAAGRARVGDVDFDRHRYVQLPPEFWTNGWMATLSAPAVAMYLILLNEKGASAASTGLWLSPKVAGERYGLSSDTRTSGFDELRRARLIDLRRQAVSSRVFDVVRYRNVHTLQPDQLKDKAALPNRPERPKPAAAKAQTEVADPAPAADPIATKRKVKVKRARRDPDAS